MKIVYHTWILTFNPKPHMRITLSPDAHTISPTQYVRLDIIGFLKHTCWLITANTAVTAPCTTEEFVTVILKLFLATATVVFKNESEFYGNGYS